MALNRYTSKKTVANQNYSNNNNNTNNNNDFQESVNRSLGETKGNIKKSIDLARTQIPRINSIVNRYQEESLKNTKDISEEYIEFQKDVVNSL
jgi:hypothetical protein